MRVTTVPAQVTTVEDRIAGNLGLSQLILLCAPVFVGGLFLAVLPPDMHITPFKAVFITMLIIGCGVSAIRVKGKIVLFWMAILLHYRLRPRYYVFDKHNMYGREQYTSVTAVIEEEKVKVPERARKVSLLSLEERAKVQEAIENPAANLAFETRKGGLYVRIREVKQES